MLFRIFRFGLDGGGCTDELPSTLSSNDVQIEIEVFSGWGLLGIEWLVVPAVSWGARSRRRAAMRRRSPGLVAAEA